MPKIKRKPKQTKWFVGPCVHPHPRPRDKETEAYRLLYYGDDVNPCAIIYHRGYKILEALRTESIEGYDGR